MTSRHRRPDRPIRSAKLEISLKADATTVRKVKGAFPSAVAKRDGCEIQMRTESLSEAAGEVRRLREVLKDFKSPERPKRLK